MPAFSGLHVRTPLTDPQPHTCHLQVQHSGDQWQGLQSSQGSCHGPETSFSSRRRVFLQLAPQPRGFHGDTRSRPWAPRSRTALAWPRGSEPRLRPGPRRRQHRSRPRAPPPGASPALRADTPQDASYPPRVSSKRRRRPSLALRCRPPSSRLLRLGPLRWKSPA